MQVFPLQGVTGAVSATNSPDTSTVSFGAVLAGLITAVKAGDAATAQNYLGMAQSVAGGLAPNSTLGRFLNQVDTALSNGDVSAARDAVATLQSKVVTVTPATDPTASDSESDGAVLSTAGNDVATLFDAMNSSDLPGAQSAYNSLKALVSNKSRGSSQSSVAQRMQNLLAEIGPSLDAGNMTSARQSLNAFLHSLSAGSMVNVNA